MNKFKIQKLSSGDYDVQVKGMFAWVTIEMVIERRI